MCICKVQAVWIFQWIRTK